MSDVDPESQTCWPLAQVRCDEQKKHPPTCSVPSKWMFGKSRTRLAPVLTEAPSWMSDRRAQDHSDEGVACANLINSPLTQIPVPCSRSQRFQINCRGGLTSSASPGASCNPIHRASPPAVASRLGS